MQTSLSKIIESYFRLYIQIQLHHWQTRQYASHIASDSLLESLSSKMDEFIETWSQHSRVRFPSSYFQIQTTSQLSKKTHLYPFLYEFKQDLHSLNFPKKSRAELQNIRDELLGIIDHALFRFSLH